MSEEEFEAHLMDALYEYAEENDEAEPEIETFERAGLRTDNHGLVVRIGDAEFQVTIIRT